jgi:uncharacterized protein (DUF58 family)
VNALSLFLLQVLAVAAPLALIARALRAYPHRRLVALAMLPLLASLVPVVAAMGVAAIGLVTNNLGDAADWLAIWDDERFWPGVALAYAAVGALALFDLLLLPSKKALEFERHTGQTASLAKPHPVELIVNNRGRRTLSIGLSDDIGDDLTAEPAGFEFRLKGRTRASLEYKLRATNRGKVKLERVYVTLSSPLGLWRRYVRYPLDSSINVYPNLVQLEQYALLARQNRLSLLGVRKSRRVGGDNDFERLRDYTPDDQYKNIDWRSTARRGKLTVRDFQADQSQRLIFLIDCGRMMTNEAEGLTLLDHAFNSMLMLSYVALSHGDQVGLVTFSDDVHNYVPLGGGRRHINRLLHSSFDRFPRAVESRYDTAFMHVATHCHKRSLVILITNVIDEVNGLQLQQYLSTLGGRHLPMGVLLRDRRIFDYAEAPDPEGPSLYRAAAAADILIWRHQVLADLHAQGVRALDVFPEELSTPLINQYLEIKARHLL